MPASGEEEERSYHFLGRCSDRMSNRYSVFGSCLLELEDLKIVKPIKLVWLAKTSQRFM